MLFARAYNRIRKTKALGGIMAEIQRFYLDRFVLTVNKACYLVEVETSFDRERRVNQLKDLPSWVFESKHVIWLKDEKANIAERAREGERIRHELMQTLH
jgi:hypothetical protein